MMMKVWRLNLRSGCWLKYASTSFRQSIATSPEQTYSAAGRLPRISVISTSPFSFIGSAIERLPKPLRAISRP